MISAHHRLKGGAALLGATGPGDEGPFGRWPTGGPIGDDGQEHDEQPESEAVAHRTRWT